MLPELARRAIDAYSNAGDLVVDPMCGVGTTLVEAIHLDRRALGIELEQRWSALAVANLALAREQGARGKAGVIEGGMLPKVESSLRALEGSTAWELLCRIKDATDPEHVINPGILGLN